MEIQRFMHVPLYVDGVQVTAETMAEIAKWCGGVISERKVQGRTEEFIKVQVNNPPSIRQTQAHVGDWVLKTKTGFKIYFERAMTKTFVLCKTDEINDSAEKLLTDIFQEPAV